MRMGCSLTTTLHRTHDVVRRYDLNESIGKNASVCSPLSRTNRDCRYNTIKIDQRRVIRTRYINRGRSSKSSCVFVISPRSGRFRPATIGSRKMKTISTKRRRCDEIITTDGGPHRNSELDRVRITTRMCVYILWNTYSAVPRDNGGEYHRQK